jgi:hypothetical protein
MFYSLQKVLALGSGLSGVLWSLVGCLWVVVAVSSF